MEKELIRTNILNLTLSQWDKVKEIETAGFINVTPIELIKLIGFNGGMFLTTKANKRETKFIDNFYKYGRLNNRIKSKL